MRRQKIPHLVPVIWWTESEFKDYFTACPGSNVAAQVLAELAGRAPIGLQNCGIEPPKTPEACRQSNLCDRQITFVQQTFGKLKTSGLRKGDRRCSYVLHKQATEMT
jgi:hypothetical protein